MWPNLNDLNGQEPRTQSSYFDFVLEDGIVGGGIQWGTL